MNALSMEPIAQLFCNITRRGHGISKMKKDKFTSEVYRVVAVVDLLVEHLERLDGLIIRIVGVDGCDDVRSALQRIREQ